MLTDVLIRIFVPHRNHLDDPRVRLRYGLLAGWGGITVNLLLFGVKLTLGLISGSIAIAADAANNLSDAGNSLVTVFGFKLSAKPADNEHPFGHGRLEYVAGLIVSVLLLAVGFDFFKEALIRIFRPEKLLADNWTLGIFAGTILFKGYLFLFYRRIGSRIQSQVIRAAAFDSLSDILGTLVVLIAVFAARYTTLPVDGAAGVLVALLIIYGGACVLRDTVNPLLGECPDKHLVEELEKQLRACPGIRGIHDVIMHNYGPNQYFATAHAEVSRDGDLQSVHDTLENAEVAIARSMPVRLILHCDPFNTEDPEVKNWRARTENEVTAFDRNFKLYDFHLEKTNGAPHLHFQMLIPRNYFIGGDEITRILTARMRKYDPGIELHIDYLNAFV